MEELPGYDAWKTRGPDDDYADLHVEDITRCGCGHELAEHEDSDTPVCLHEGCDCHCFHEAEPDFDDRDEGVRE